MFKSLFDSIPFNGGYNFSLLIFSDLLKDTMSEEVHKHGGNSVSSNRVKPWQQDCDTMTCIDSKIESNSPVMKS